MFVHCERSVTIALMTVAVVLVGCNSDDDIEQENPVDPAPSNDVRPMDVAFDAQNPSSDAAGGPDDADGGPDVADGAGSCAPRSICEDGGCSLPVELPAPTRQSFEIILTEEPPRDWNGDLRVSADSGAVRGSFDLAFSGSAGGSGIDRTTATLFPGNYDLAWPATSALEPIYGFVDDDLPRRGVPLPTAEPVRVTGRLAENVSTSGTIRIDGQPVDEIWPIPEDEDASNWEWELVFYDSRGDSTSGTGGEVARVSGTLEDATFEAELPPITYDVYLEIHHRDFGGNRERYVVGGEKLVAEDFAPDDESLEISPETARLEGDVNVEGANCSGDGPTDQPCTLVFLHRETPERFTHDISPGGTYQTRIPPGTYDVFVQLPGLEPVTRSVARDVTIDGNRSLDIVSQIVDVELVPEWNGRPAVERLPSGAAGEVTLRSTDSTSFGSSGQYTGKFGEEDGEDLGETATLSVPPGDYEVRGKLPIDSIGDVRLEQQVTISAGSGTTSRTVEFQTTEVSLDATIGGTELAEITPSRENTPILVLYPAYIDDEEQFYMHDDALWVEASELQDGSMTLYDGSYDVDLRRDYANFPLERGDTDSESTYYTTDTLPVDRDWNPGAENTLEFDRATRSLEGRALLGGAPLRNEQRAGEPTWALRFEDRETGQVFTRAFDGTSDDWQADMYTGEYDIYANLLAPDRPGSLRSLSIRIAECVEIR